MRDTHLLVCFSAASRRTSAAPLVRSFLRIPFPGGLQKPGRAGLVSGFLARDKRARETPGGSWAKAGFRRQDRFAQCDFVQSRMREDPDIIHAGPVKAVGEGYPRLEAEEKRSHEVRTTGVRRVGEKIERHLDVFFSVCETGCESAGYPCAAPVCEGPGAPPACSRPAKNSRNRNPLRW